MGLSLPVVSQTLLNSTSELTHSLLLRPLILFFSLPRSIYFTCVLVLIRDPCPRFVSLLGLGMRLQAFVRLSEVQRKGGREGRRGEPISLTRPALPAESEERFQDIVYVDSVVSSSQKAQTGTRINLKGSNRSSTVRLPLLFL